MAHTDDEKHWYDVDRAYSSDRSRDSDDSPILSYRHDKRRLLPPREGKEERSRRSTVTLLAKFFLFSAAMIMFCVLLYIPVYNKANYHVPKGFVAGWSVHTNRDTKIYVQPTNVTTVHEPKDFCTDRQDKLFLLIVVCSSTLHFDRRIAIRDTWGNYKKYLEASVVFNKVRERYKHYNYSYDLYKEIKNNESFNNNVTRRKRGISGLGQLLPELAKALQSNLANEKTDSVENRFDDDEETMLPEFDMNKELGEDNDVATYDDYESNVMKIPPNGFEEGPDLAKVLSLLKKDKKFPKLLEGNTVPDFKLLFLLGLPSHDNDTEVQMGIEEEVEKYGDIIQEGFIDSYNNLTLKSIMMLKWITNRCNNSVRYILKTDDDMFINVPNLVANLRNRSKEYDDKVSRGYKEKELLLIGDLICGARPVLDSNSKWYSPRYMYGGRVYPRYLSGTGYVLSADTALVLYAAALTTNYFHLEDIYITGLCAQRAQPRVVARDDPGFTYQVRRAGQPCSAHGHVTAHRVPPRTMRELAAQLTEEPFVDRCERMRLTQIKEKRDGSLLYRYLRLLVTNNC